MRRPKRTSASRLLTGARAAGSGLALAACAAQGPSALERATSLAREHREADATRVLRAHLSRHEDDLASRRLLVRVLALAGDLPAARREVELLAERLEPNDPVPFLELGHVHELAHRYEAALELYDRAAEIAPTDPRGPREGGLRAARWGESGWSRPRLEEAVRRGGGNREVWHALGLVLAHEGDLPAAERAYRAGLAADPTALECRLGLATVFVLRGDAGGALGAYETLAEARPRWPDAHLGRAWALARLGRRDEAREALAEAERLGGDPSVVAAQRRALAAPPP